MKDKTQTDGLKFLIKLPLALAVDVVFCVLVSLIYYDIEHHLLDNGQIIHDIIIWFLLICVCVGTIILHFILYKKFKPFEKKGFKIAYLILSLFFAVPYVWLQVLYIIALIFP